MFVHTAHTTVIIRAKMCVLYTNDYAGVSLIKKNTKMTKVKKKTTILHMITYEQIYSGKKIECVLERERGGGGVL